MQVEGPVGLLAPVRRLYAWILSWGSSPYGMLALFALSFAESFIFPLPPDPLLIALCLGARHRALQIAAVCTVGSVLGGIAGYYLGYLAFEAAARPILELYGVTGDFEALAKEFREVGAQAVLIAAITPVPYKLVTITSGAVGMSLGVFIGASIVGRASRFFALAALIWWKGETIAAFIEKYFEILSVVFAVLLIGGFVAISAFSGGSPG